MGRRDKHEKQAQRARSELDTMLARGRIGEAVDAWLTLPASERLARLDQLATAAVTEIARAHRAQDHTAMLAWLRRMESAPELLAQGAASAPTCWMLLAAALRARQWPRARALLDQLEPALAQSPSLPALRAVIRHEGSPPAGTLPTDSPPAAGADDVRLGHARKRPGVGHPAPTRVEDVERLTLDRFVSAPWAEFRGSVATWLTGMPAPIAAETRRLAAALSHRELIRRHARSGRDALEVARFCAESALAAGTPAELEPVIELSMRALASHLTGIVAHRAVVEACAAVVGAALRYPRLAPLVEPLVLGAQYDLAVVDHAEQMIRGVLDARPSISLVVKAARILALRAGSSAREMTAPPWLLQPLECFLRDPARLAAALRASSDAPTRGRSTDLQALTAVLPVALAVRLVCEVWDAADEGLRAALAEESEELVERMRGRAPSRGRDNVRSVRARLGAIMPELGMGASDAELREILESPMGRELHRLLGALDDQEEPISPTHHRSLDLLSERVAPYSLVMLEVTLESADSQRTKLDWIRRFWARRPTLLERVKTLHDAALHDRSEPLLRERLADGLVPSPVDCARALEYLIEFDAPVMLRRKVAMLLVDVVARDPGSASDAAVDAALREARRYVKRGTKKAATPKARAQKTPARKAAARPTPTKKQQTLFDDPEKDT